MNYLEENHAALSSVQTLVLEYCYGFVLRVTDTSLLSVAEIYGHWRWYDFDSLTVMETILDACRRGRSLNGGDSALDYLNFELDDMVKLLGILTAAVEDKRLKALDGTPIAVPGKLTIVTSGHLASLTSASSVPRCFLLDIDPTAIPSDTRGAIFSGEPCFFRNEIRPGATQELRDVDFSGLPEDFTFHIEPDWDQDSQRCQTLFRFRGRVVGRFQPNAIEWVL